MATEAKDDMKGAVKSTLLCCTSLMDTPLGVYLGTRTKQQLSLSNHSKKNDPRFICNETCQLNKFCLLIHHFLCFFFSSNHNYLIAIFFQLSSHCFLTPLKAYRFF